MNGGNAGVQGGGTCGLGTCDTNAFVAALNTAALCGFHDWRMPTRRELVSAGRRLLLGESAEVPDPGVVEIDFDPPEGFLAPLGRLDKAITLIGSEIFSVSVGIMQHIWISTLRNDSIDLYDIVKQNASFCLMIVFIGIHSNESP